MILLGGGTDEQQHEQPLQLDLQHWDWIYPFLLWWTLPVFLGTWRSLFMIIRSTIKQRAKHLKPVTVYLSQANSTKLHLQVVSKASESGLREPWWEYLLYIPSSIDRSARFSVYFTSTATFCSPFKCISLYLFTLASGNK